MDSPANCLVDAFLDQVEHPPEINGEVLRLLVVEFFLNNVDKYKVQTFGNNAYSHEYALQSCVFVRIRIITAYLCHFQDQIKQDIEGDEPSLGVWCIKTMNPETFLGATFIYLLQEMVQVKNNSHIFPNI